MSEAPTSADPPKPRKSILVNVGVLLFLLGVFVPPRLQRVIPTLEQGVLRSVCLLATDLFISFIFIGVGCFLIGQLRNRRFKKQTLNKGVHSAADATKD